MKAGISIVVGLVFVSFLMPASEDVFEAAKSGDLRRMESLLKADPGSVRLRDKSGRTALQIAALYGQAEMAEVLIRSGADVNTRDNYGNTPLQNALRNEELEVVKRLAAGGAAVPVSGEEGRETLHRAAWVGCGELLKRMAGQGADLRSRNNNGGTLLHSVVRGRLPDWTKRLLDSGFDPNARDRYSLTPLDLAAIGGQNEVIRMLLDNRADIRARTVEGKNAYHLAMENGQAGSALLLRSRGAETRDPEFPLLEGDYFGQKPPGMTAEPFAVGMVSTMDWEHGGPVFSPDGKEMYWSPVIYGGSRGCIMVSRRVQGRWSLPVPAPFTKKEYREMGPGLSADGKRLYFTSYRPIDADPKGERIYRLWYADRTARGWSDPQPLPAPINLGAGTARSALAVGDVLYFGSWRTGRSLIYRSQLRDGRWAVPEALPINSTSTQICSYVSRNDRFLIFESNRPGGYGGFDLYAAFRNGDGTWTKPVNLGDKVNSAAQEWFASVSSDGKYLFFTSDRNGNDDVYWIDVRAVEALRRDAARGEARK